MSVTQSSTEFHTVAERLKFPSKAFIGGEWKDAISGEVFELTNPATGEVFTHVAACDSQDVDAAVLAARSAFQRGTWSRSAPEFRKAVLLKLADLIRQNTVELATLESLNAGKTITDCLAEIGHDVPMTFQWFAELIDKSFGKIAPTGDDALGLIVKEPIGVVGLILPWNFPMLMAAWKVAPALAAGCSIVLKPAELTPLTALRLAELAAEAGVPPGVLNVVPGLGETAGRAIGLHNSVDAVSFTGSAEVGGYFLGYAGQSNLKPVGLELGGKSPLIVLEDAQINDDLINSAVLAACWNGGQNCTANMRQIIHKNRKEEFLHKVVERISTLKIGDPLSTETDMGAMISAEHRDKVLSYIESGKSDGARAVFGQQAVRNHGFFVDPTVFDGVRPEMRIAREEIFGPVLGIIEVESGDEALKIAIDTDFGLHATVFTRDIDRAIHMARRLPCGTVSINKYSEGNITTPFGGYKKSGSLARDKGTEALDQYMQTKTIWVNLSSVS